MSFSVGTSRAGSRAVRAQTLGSKLEPCLPRLEQAWNTLECCCGTSYSLYTQSKMDDLLLINFFSKWSISDHYQHQSMFHWINHLYLNNWKTFIVSGMAQKLVQSSNRMGKRLESSSPQKRRARANTIDNVKCMWQSRKCEWQCYIVTRILHCHAFSGLWHAF